MSAGELERALNNYLKLSLATAQRAFRFWNVRGVMNLQSKGDELPH